MPYFAGLMLASTVLQRSLSRPSYLHYLTFCIRLSQDNERHIASVNRDSLGVQRYAMELAVVMNDVAKVNSMPDLFAQLNEVCDDVP